MLLLYKRKIDNFEIVYFQNAIVYNYFIHTLFVRNTSVSFKNSATIEKAPPKYELHFFYPRVFSV